MLFNTVGLVLLYNNHYRYSSHDYSKATLAHKIQRTIGRPSIKQIISILNENLLPNWLIDKNDILATENIFWPDIGALKGKTTWRNTKSVSLKRSNISPDLLLQYREVTVAMDIMFVNKVPYLMSRLLMGTKKEDSQLQLTWQTISLRAIEIVWNTTDHCFCKWTCPWDWKVHSNSQRES